ncbi:sucrase ferredoxin [Yinghuangia seranimata]|uniref:sucrase ferredoxin n=1 Tax=Yinghuangia seranimata TaxID=408067 RepID=UPI00248CA2BC|nr:sucrase ferredoxin [Yinghuangia seranimata]MDI2131232.1 sucrase ferredoxin [Yinghuangia seranimata]
MNTPQPRGGADRTGRPSPCAAVARALGESVLGSAPETCDAWLLVEHPGPWPAYDIPASVPRDVAEFLDRLPAFRIRPQLVRRPGARRPVPPHQIYVAYSGGPRGAEVWLEEREVADLRELFDLDLGAVSRGERPRWGTPRTDPVLLVCTHGKREPCCARFGRPTVRALHDAYGEPVWETTHVGGDRFAANVVALPHGTYHGMVTEPAAAEVGAACLRGEVSLAHYRGRMGVPAAVQAAEWFARNHTGAVEVGAVRPLAHVDGVDGGATVDLVAGGRLFQVTVRTARTGCPRLTSCSQGAVTDPDEFVLDELRELTA